jgi:hypothetical protein
MDHCQSLLLASGSSKNLNASLRYATPGVVFTLTPAKPGRLDPDLLPGGALAATEVSFLTAILERYGVGDTATSSSMLEGYAAP